MQNGYGELGEARSAGEREGWGLGGAEPRQGGTEEHLLHHSTITL